jgi:predicted ArsR family transcriptional regulator
MTFDDHNGAIGHLAASICTICNNEIGLVAFVLDAHQNQRPQHLVASSGRCDQSRLSSSPPQIAADLFDQVLLVVRKIGNCLQQRLKT